MTPEAESLATSRPPTLISLRGVTALTPKGVQFKLNAMPAPKNLHLFDWNVMMDTFNKESDRGAAVLVGGFTESYLGVYLRSLVVDPKVATDLFSSMGPLSSFSQRIAVAYAFGFITKEHFDNLNLVRRIRNHFAHHPLEASFSTNEVAQLTKQLSTLKTAVESKPEDDALLYRRAYVFACAFFCGYAHMKQEGRSKQRETTSDDDA